MVCKEGQILTPNQAQILKLVGECLAEFKITLKCVWNKDGEFRKLQTDDSKNSAVQKDGDDEVEEDEEEDNDEEMEEK